MENAFYIFGTIAAVLLIIAVPVLTVRALILMARLESTRHDLAELIAEGSLSLQHVNRLLARMQEGVDQLRRALEHLEPVLLMAKSASTVGGLLSGARRVFSGRHREDESSQYPEDKENENA